MKCSFVSLGLAYKANVKNVSKIWNCCVPPVSFLTVARIDGSSCINILKPYRLTSQVWTLVCGLHTEQEPFKKKTHCRFSKMNIWFEETASCLKSGLYLKLRLLLHGSVSKPVTCYHVKLSMIFAFFYFGKFPPTRLCNSCGVLDSVFLAEIHLPPV